MVHIFLALFFLFVASTASAANESGDSIVGRLARQVAAFPQEKLYTQIDLAEYFAGDTIWMRHHVVEAQTGTPSYASRYVYAELISPMGTLVRRVMMRQDENGAIYGYMPTDSDLPSGQYSLRTYTRHMAGATPDNLFVRSLRIRNVLESSVRISSAVNGGRLHLSFTDPKTGSHIHNGNVKVESFSGDVAFTGNTDKGIDIHMLDVGSSRRYVLVRVGNYGEYIPVANEYIDLQLMPEGGHMVSGQRCRVAYKAVAHTGLGVDMMAKVMDDQGTVVTENSATHCGMGIFYLTPQPGRSYHVVCTSRDGRTATASLPKAEIKAPSLSVAQNSKRFIANVLWPNNEGVSGEAVRDTLWLIVHQEGLPLYANRVVQPTIGFSRDVFRDGVVHFLLADKNLNVISERLCFAWNGSSVYGDTCSVSVATAERGMRKVSVSLPDGVNANCAVSIVDADVAKADTVHGIVSTLLLSQELRGYIEQPEWYFASRARSGQLDVLMMTQGWRRYDIQKAMRGGVAEPVGDFERSMAISGKVTSDVSPKGKKDAAVTMSSTIGGLFDATTTDADGRFVFSGFEMPDSTGYMLMARSAKGSDNLVLRLDQPKNPDVVNDLPVLYMRSDAGDVEASRKAADRIAVGQGGKVFFLPEVTVTSRYRKMTEFESMTKLNGLSIKGDALKKESNKSVLDYLKTEMQTGLKFDYNVNWFFHRNVPSYFVLDGSVWNGDEIYEWDAYRRIRKSKGGLSEEEQGIVNRLAEDHRAMTAIMESVRLRDVQQIDIIKGPMAGTLSGIVRTTNNTGMDLSAIAITTRNGSGEVGKNTRLVKPMGYQKPVNFYNPRYEVPNDYTLRHTVYWNPSLRIKDGKATFDFLPNGAKRYRISVEGIGTEGQVVCISK